MNNNKHISAKPNYSKRTFTIRKYNGKDLIAKFRTTEMSEEEFMESEYNTEGDWEDFLKMNECIIIR